MVPQSFSNFNCLSPKATDFDLVMMILASYWEETCKIIYILDPLSEICEMTFSFKGYRQPTKR